jgi:hypothetical protein
MKVVDECPTTTADLKFCTVLYKWDAEGIQGWFPAKVHGAVTGRPPLNWFMKYDIQQTSHKNLNGVIATQLELSGRFGYGQRWVLIEPTDVRSVTNVVDDGKMQLGLRGPMSRGAEVRSLDVSIGGGSSLLVASQETSFM